MTATDRPVGRSRAVSCGGYFGEIPEGVWQVLDRAWFDPPSISSNYARQAAPALAVAASLGWITVIAPDGHSLSRSWHITAEGLTAYRNRNIWKGPDQ